MSDLVGNPEDRFSRVAAQYISLILSNSFIVADQNWINSCSNNQQLVSLIQRQVYFSFEKAEEGHNLSPMHNIMLRF